MIDNKKYIDRNKKLKKLGISKINNKKNYSTQEKRQISRLYNKFGHAADLSAKPFTDKRGTTITYSSRELKNRKEIKLARESGYQVYKNKILIKHNVAEKVRLKRSKTVVSDGEIVLQIELKKKNIRRDIQIAEKYNLMNFLENQGKVRVPNGVKITVKIGNDSPFMTHGAISTSYNQLLNYISNWEPKDVATGKMTKEQGKKLKLDLIGQMSIVTIQ